MPLWNIYHTDDAFNGEEKAELADRITNIVYPHLPAFYVGVVFQEVTAENFYIAGKPAKNFVRIWIDHIARTLPLPEQKADWMRRAHKAVLPIFTARGVNWELHVDETPRDLWLIQGLIPPMPNTEQEKKWHADNKPTPYAIEAAVTAQQTRPRKLAAGRGRDLQAEKLAIIDVYASICSPPWCRRDENAPGQEGEDTIMRFPTFQKLAVALSIATFGVVAPFTHTMAQTNAQPQKLTGSAALFAEGQSTEAKQADAYFDNYPFRSGEVIEKLRLHFATLGVPHRNAQGEIDNAVLVLHWTDASGGALLTPNYIEALFAPGRPLDASRYYLIFPDNVGHGLSSKPSDGLKAKFPNYGYNDMVDLQHKLVTETLGIKRLHAILGMSMGGMNAWQWAEAYPDAMDGIMPVVALPTKISGRNLLWRRIVIEGIRTDPDWKNGNYDLPPAGWLKGYAVLRMMIDGVQHLQAEIPNGAAADRIMAELHEQASSIDANDTLYALKSSGDYDPEPNLTAIKTKVLALNFGDDEFNPERVHLLGRLISKVHDGHAVVQPGSDRSFGHLTMAHPELWAHHVADFMRELGDNPKKERQSE